MQGFYSASQHINLSSRILTNWLQVYSTLVRYCNSSEDKPQVIIMPQAVILQSKADQLIALIVLDQLIGYNLLHHFLLILL